MAIKGKGKSKRRGVATAPKPVLVQRKRPLLARRGLWITAGIVAFVAAAAGITLALLIGNHHKHQREARQAARRAQTRIVREFGTQLDNALASVGKGSTLSSFQAFPTLGSTISEFGSGKLKPKVADDQADTVDKQASDAFAAVQKIDAAGLVGTHSELEGLVNGQGDVEHGLQLYQQVAASLKLATAATGKEQKQLVAHAGSLLSIANSVFTQGYQALVALRAKVGIVSLSPPSGVPPGAGLPPTGGLPPASP
jgi:hypothetical protein